MATGLLRSLSNKQMKDLAM